MDLQTSIKKEESILQFCCEGYSRERNEASFMKTDRFLIVKVVDLVSNKMKLGLTVFCSAFVLVIAYTVFSFYVMFDFGKEWKTFGGESCVVVGRDIPAVEDITRISAKFALGCSDDRIELWERSNPNTPNGSVVLINLSNQTV
jgi:hypothetical protein